MNIPLPCLRSAGLMGLADRASAAGNLAAGARRLQHLGSWTEGGRRANEHRQDGGRQLRLGSGQGKLRVGKAAGRRLAGKRRCASWIRRDKRENRWQRSLQANPAARQAARIAGLHPASATAGAATAQARAQASRTTGGARSSAGQRASMAGKGRSGLSKSSPARSNAARSQSSFAAGRGPGTESKPGSAAPGSSVSDPFGVSSPAGPGASTGAGDIPH